MRRKQQHERRDGRQRASSADARQPGRTHPHELIPHLRQARTIRRSARCLQRRHRRGTAPASAGSLPAAAERASRCGCLRGMRSWRVPPFAGQFEAHRMLRIVGANFMPVEHGIAQASGWPANAPHRRAPTPSCEPRHSRARCACRDPARRRAVRPVPASPCSPVRVPPATRSTASPRSVRRLLRAHGDARIRRAFRLRGGQRIGARQRRQSELEAGAMLPDVAIFQKNDAGRHDADRQQQRPRQRQRGARAGKIQLNRVPHAALLRKCSS